MIKLNVEAIDHHLNQGRTRGASIFHEAVCKISSSRYQYRRAISGDRPHPLHPV